MKTEPYPFDFDAYPRGSVVPVSVLERASGYTVEKDERKYRLWCLKVISMWRKHFLAQGMGWVSIAMQGYSIKVMEDGQEQLEYTRKGKRMSRTMFLNRHLEQGSVNPSLLSDTERERWRRELERDSKMLAFDRPKRKLPPLKFEELGEGEGE